MLEFPLVRITSGSWLSNVAATAASQPCFHMGGCQSKEELGAIIICSAGSLAATNIAVVSAK